MGKADLIKELKSLGVLISPKLKRAFKKIDRKDFVLPEFRNVAYENHPLPIGFGQTISQPFTVAFMLGLLNVRAGDKILEIGAGSGWQTALLCFLAGKKGRVMALERIPELKIFAEKNLNKYCTSLPAEVPRRGTKAGTLMQKDATDGYAQEAPFDKIIAAASARKIPQAWKDQLKTGGRIVAPVKDSIVVLDKISDDKFKTTIHPGFIFVPLVKG